MTMLWLDCETVGLLGSVKTIQLAVDNGPIEIIVLKRGWERDPAVRERLLWLRGLLDSSSTVFTGFNIAFDLFHLYRTFHALSGLPYDSPGRPCLPFGCRSLDLQVSAMLHSPLSPFAFSRNRSRSIARVRRIPKIAMEVVAYEVTTHLRPLVPAHFGLHLGVHKVDRRPDLVTLSWTVEGSLSLKGLMKEYGIPTITLEDVWPLPERDSEKPWLPYPDPSVHDPVEARCDRVLENPDANFWRYAKLDILYLRELYSRLGTPAPDHHSECAHAIAFTRYAGFPVNSRTLDLSLAHYGARVSELEGKLGEEVLKSHQKRLAMLQALDPLVAASNKRVLSVLADSDRPSASLARDMLDYGPYRQRLLQLQKVKESRTGRAHPDFRVMGTSTARMSGTAGLNWQGIGAAESVEIEEWVDNEREDREFESPEETGEIESEIARDDEKEEGGRRETVGLRAAIETPCVGDFASFEVTIAASVFKDRQLQEDLDHGRDLHAMAVAQAHPEARKRKLTYDQVLAGYRAHDPTITRWRKGMKAVVFGIFYGASAQKVADVLNVSVQEGEEVLEAFYERYEGIGRYKAETERAFVTADTSRWSVESIGSMESAREDLVGFRRSWHFERDCAVTLWGLGSRGVRTGCHGTVVRQQEKGAQSIDQAVRSGLLGSAIAIQAAVCRQAGNMPIQATGANLTKFLMADCWRILRCPLMNVHDELVFGSDRFHARTLSGIVEAFEARYRPLVPPLKFDYKPTRVWADK